MAAVHVNPDLARERTGATFDVDQLTYFLYHGAEKTRRKRFIQNLAVQDLSRLGMKQYTTLSRVEQYEQAIQKYAYFIQTNKRLGLTDAAEQGHLMEAVLPCEASPFTLHPGAFVSTFTMLASEEQKAKWLPMMKEYRMVGTYVQTEMGHGSFLRGLETTATYNPDRQEFVLHCPNVSSIKYWPGGLGKTVNSCVLMAQLISKGQNLGMHSFLVQIRDFDTHQPLPGITVGDIGNKFGFHGNDNGFLRFDNVRIPRENMLMRHSQILPDGTYIAPKNDRLMYGGMTALRAGIVAMVSRKLSMAVTIAVRYSAVRRQSEIQAGAGEVQVLDFQTQQHRLFPQIAAAYATTIASDNVGSYYRHVSAQIDKGDLQELPMLHALSAGLKAYCSWVCSEGVEVCRLACGGHGYSQASGLPKIYVDTAPACTYEGESFVLMLQTARYLVKCCHKVSEGGQLPEVMRFLNTIPGEKSQLDSRLSMLQLVHAYQHRAGRLSQEVTQKLAAAVVKGMAPGEAWNANSVHLISAGKAFAQLYLVQRFAETVGTLSGKLRSVMEALCRLYAVSGILTALGDFMQDGYISSDHAAMLQGRQLELLTELRPNAVALVDAFDFPDAVLDSALGRYDGQVYDALYDYSLRSKLNEKQVLDAYHKYQRPFMESQWQTNPQVAATSRL